MGFSALSNQIIATIQASAAVSTVAGRTGKSLTVRVGYKVRQEINVSDLPIVMIVRPERKLESIAARQYGHEFVIFVGLNCETREDAPGLLDDLENAIEDALVENYSLNGTAVDVNFIGSSNDMGMYHPVYFTSMQFNIQARK